MTMYETSVEDPRGALLSGSRAARRHPAQAAYLTLQAALETGWHVEPPIYARPDWSLKHKDAVAFHFVLKNGVTRLTTLLSVPDGDEVRRLIAEQGWEVSERRA